jgi:hypothetical protein
MRKALLGAFVVLAAACGPKAPNPVGPNPVPTTTAPSPASAGPSVDLKHVGIPLPDDESYCTKLPDGTFKDPVPPGKYTGILRNAHCDQQRFITMASLMKQLGIKECTYCHATDPDDPNHKPIYSQPTEKKKIANWMLATFVDGLRNHDGKPMTCQGCHNDGQGNAAIKILRQPRDTAYAQEWMNEVMTSRFLARGGERLRCKTCHVGMAPSREGWNPHVLLQLECTGAGEIRRLPPQSALLPGLPPAVHAR